MGMLRLAPAARYDHSLIAFVALGMSKAESLLNEKIIGDGCHGLGFSYVNSFKTAKDAMDAGVVVTGTYEWRTPSCVSLLLLQTIDWR